MKNFNVEISKVDEQMNNKRGYISYKLFKYWTLIMLLIIIPLTPILITAFGFHSIDQYKLQFSPDQTLVILSVVSVFFNELNWEELLGTYSNIEWLKNFDSSTDLFFWLFNNNVVTLDFTNGILFFNLSAFNDFLSNHKIIIDNIDLENIEEWAEKDDNPTEFITFIISEFSIDKIWWVIGPCIAIAIITVFTSILWTYFSKFNEKNIRGEQNFK